MDHPLENFILIPFITEAGVISSAAQLVEPELGRPQFMPIILRIKLIRSMNQRNFGIGLEFNGNRSFIERLLNFFMND